MTAIRIRDAAELLGVSDDTVRRWVSSGQLTATSGDRGVATVDGAALAATVRGGHPTTAVECCDRPATASPVSSPR